MNEKITKNTTLFLNKGVISEYFEDGAVLYTDDSESFFAIDRFGAEILKYIENNNSFTIEDMMTLFYEKYYVSKSELENDLIQYMLKLGDIGAIKIAE